MLYPLNLIICDRISMLINNLEPMDGHDTFEKLEGKEGAFVGVGFNFDNMIPEDKNNRESHEWQYPKFHEGDDWENYFGSYGMCDYPEQVFEKCPTILESDRKFVVSFHEVTKASQPSDGGFRPHKWGAYIGEHVDDIENHEYLYDCEKVESVYVYHIYEISPEREKFLEKISGEVENLKKFPKQLWPDNINLFQQPNGLTVLVPN